MHLIQKTLVIILCSVAAWYGWTAFARSAREVVTLRVSDVRNKDYYARLWVVEERPYLWIRAESPDRRWLPPLRERSSVTLWRGDRRSRYDARAWEDPDARRYVDALFREKYGLADLARDWLLDRQTIPIRLTPL